MQHQCRCGSLEVDHFDPRKKKNLWQDYDNLFPASRYCNGKKSDNWPSRAEEAAGCRFLNPCKEMDYGEQIFENPATHLVYGVTPAAKWHIRMCGLNADHLVEERKRRSTHRKALTETFIMVKGDQQKAVEVMKMYREEVELMIPPIVAKAQR